MSAELKRGLACILWAVSLFACRDDAQSALSIGGVSRQSLGAHVELVQLTLLRGPAPGGRAHLVYADPAHIDISVRLNEARSPLARLDSDALLTMNGAFFTPGYAPTGLLVSEGRQLHPFIKEAGGAGSGVIVLENDEVELIERDLVGTRDLSKSRLAIQAGPRVIEANGAPGIRKDDGVRAHRSFIGRSEDGRLALGVVLGPSGWSSGPSLFELQRVLSDHALGSGRLHVALNLDGGPSTGMYLRHPDHRVNEPESATVYSYLVMRLKP